MCVTRLRNWFYVFINIHNTEIYKQNSTGEMVKNKIQSRKNTQIQNEIDNIKVQAAARNN